MDAGCSSTTATRRHSSTLMSRIFYSIERLWKDCPFSRSVDSPPHRRGISAE